MTSAPSSPPVRPYALFLLGVSTLALLGLAAHTLLPLDPRVSRVLMVVDLASCGLFFVDFLVQWVRAPDRRRYFFTWGWLDLLSSVPALPYLRVGRIGSFIKLFRLLRGFRAARGLTTFLVARRSEVAFFTTSLVALFTTVLASIAVLHVENVPDARILTGEDALWWAWCTITTVGYGDLYPITSEGRLVGVVLMVVGVGLFGALAAFFASWVLKPETSASPDVQALQQEVRALREQVERLVERLPR